MVDQIHEAASPFGSDALDMLGGPPKSRLLRLSEVTPDTVPWFPRTSIATLHRYATRPARGGKVLRTVLIGGIKHTSAEWLWEFCDQGGAGVKPDVRSGCRTPPDLRPATRRRGPWSPSPSGRLEVRSAAREAPSSGLRPPSPRKGEKVASGFDLAEINALAPFSPLRGEGAEGG